MDTATQILEMTAQLLRPNETVTIGVLPPEGGMTLQVTGGAADARYLDGRLPAAFDAATAVQGHTKTIV